MNSSESPSFAQPVVESFTPAPVLISPNNPPWGTLSALSVWIGSILFLIVVPIIGAIFYIAYRAVTTGLPAAQENLMADKNFIFLSVLSVFPAHLLTLGLTWLVVTRAGRYPFWKTLGWEWPAKFGPWKSVGVAVALFLLGIGLTWLIGGKRTELDEIISSSYRTRIATAVLAATTGPLIEEIVYRGILYSALQKALGAISGVIVVSLLFAGVHVWQYRNNVGVILVISLLSISLTLVRAYSGRLLPSFVIHFVFNAVQSVLLVIQKPEQLPAPPVTPAPGQIITVVLRYFT